MSHELEELKQELRAIKDRNLRVEADKAWEKSFFRTAIIVATTYIVASIALIMIGNENPFRNALVPALGFLLSIQSLPFIKRTWIRQYLRRK